MEQRKCTKCGDVKDITEFSLRRENGRVYPRCHCKVCIKKYHEYLREHPYIKPPQEVFPEGYKRCKGECKQILPLSAFGKSSQYDDGLKIACKECRNKEHRAFRAKNRKPKIKKIRTPEQELNKRVKNNLRTRLRLAIRNGQRGGSAVRDLGCSIDYLKHRLSLKFYPHPETGEEMTWDNYGKWHIDHITPLHLFDLTKRDHIIFSCHYSNLQPLWAVDNLKKGGKCPKLKEIKKMSEEKKEGSEKAEVFQGVVVFFSPTRGYGFIKSPSFEKDLFVHYSNIVMEGFRTISAEDEVTFTIGSNTKGQQAENVTVTKAAPRPNKFAEKE